MTCTSTCRKVSGRQAHCSACHHSFTTVSTFDHHRTGPADARRCADPASRGMHLNAHGVWAREGGRRFWDADSTNTIRTQGCETTPGVVPVGVEASKAAETISGGTA